MNQNTWISWITTGIGLLSSAAATKGVIDQNTAVSIAGAAGTLVPLLWGLFIHRDTKVVQTAASITGAPVPIGPTAEPALQKLAMDPTVPNVVVAAPAPNLYTTSRKA
jgi:hypothetical protein